MVQYLRRKQVQSAAQEYQAMDLLEFQPKSTCSQPMEDFGSFDTDGSVELELRREAVMAAYPLYKQ